MNLDELNISDEQRGAFILRTRIVQRREKYVNAIAFRFRVEKCKGKVPSFLGPKN